MRTAEEIVNDSGYPLQIRLEEWIKETREQHGWRVLVTEHRWVNAETKEEGYIDLVLENDRTLIKPVVECKRIAGSWTFLLPMAQPINKSETKMLFMDYKAHYLQRLGSQVNLEPSQLLWREHRISPESPEAMYCVMETGGKKDGRTLEKLAGELLLSLEYLATEEIELCNSLIKDHGFAPENVFYLPVIVTTAKLQTVSFSPSKIDISRGGITDSTEAPAEYIRFRKNLATHIDSQNPKIYGLGDINKENDRTVFVVQAENFIKFLSSVGNRR